MPLGIKGFQKGHSFGNRFKKGYIPWSKGKDLTSMPKITPDFDVGYSLGTIIGDGHLYSHPDISQGRHIIRLRVTSEEFANKFRLTLGRVTKKSLKTIPYVMKIKGKPIQLYRVLCHSKAFIKYFRYLETHLEEFVINADVDTLKGFVMGYIDSEGTVNHYGSSLYIIIRSINRLHIDLMKFCLKKLNYNIIYGVYKTPKGKPLYSVTISGIYSVRRYANEIGFSDSKKQKLALSKNYKTKLK